MFTVLKDLNPFKTYNKNQEASYNFKLGFALSNRPHFNSVYLVRMPFLNGIAVCVFFETCFCFLCLRCDKVQKWKVNSVSKIRSVFVQKNIIHLCKVAQLPYKGGIKGDNMQVGILKRSCLGNVSSPAGIL